MEGNGRGPFRSILLQPLTEGIWVWQSKFEPGISQNIEQESSIPRVRGNRSAAEDDHLSHMPPACVFRLKLMLHVITCKINFNVNYY
jgi:hypothetical protein